MNAYWGVELQLHTFSTSAIDGHEWSASCTGCYIPRETVSGTHCRGGSVGARAILDAVAKRRNACLYREMNPGLPIRSLVTVLTTTVPAEGSVIDTQVFIFTKVGKQLQCTSVLPSSFLLSVPLFNSIFFYFLPDIIYLIPFVRCQTWLHLHAVREVFKRKIMIYSQTSLGSGVPKLHTLSHKYPNTLFYRHMRFISLSL
jgi:hypothetical protein